MSRLLDSTQYSVPTAGGTVTVTAVIENIIVVLEPVGTLATLTVTLPTASHNGQQVTVTSSQIVTALTLNSAAGSILGALAAFAANGFASYVWIAAQSKWYRCG